LAQEKTSFRVEAAAASNRTHCVPVNLIEVIHGHFEFKGIHQNAKQQNPILIANHHFVKLQHWQLQISTYSMEQPREIR